MERLKVYMSLIVKLLLVAAGGSVGAILRYLLESRFNSVIITAVINCVGSLLMGFFFGWLMASAMAAERKTMFSILLMSGFCGGFSTFAHFAMITVNYFRQGSMMAGVSYIFITMIAGLMCCWIGFLLGSRLPAA